MPDEADWCCAAGICCGEQQRRKKLAHLLHHAVPSLSAAQAASIADVIHDRFTILPITLGFGPAFDALDALAREYPYDE